MSTTPNLKLNLFNGNDRPNHELFNENSIPDEVDGVENLGEIVNQEEQSEEKSLDDLQVEKSNLESDIEASNAEIQFIESELTATVVEIAEINQQIFSSSTGGRR